MADRTVFTEFDNDKMDITLIEEQAEEMNSQLH